MQIELSSGCVDLATMNRMEALLFYGQTSGFIGVVNLEVRDKGELIRTESMRTGRPFNTMDEALNISSAKMEEMCELFHGALGVNFIDTNVN